MRIIRRKFKEECVGNYKEIHRTKGIYKTVYGEAEDQTRDERFFGSKYINMELL